MSTLMSEEVEERRHLTKIIAQVSRIGNYMLGRQFEREGLPISREQWDVLVMLWEKDGRAQQEFATFLLKNRASITSLIDNMEKNNLVTRVPNPNDKRSKLIYLTRKARDLKDKVIGIAEESILVITNDIPLDDVKAGVELLRKCLSNITEYEKSISEPK
ncbi:MarR family winged helix-turn-helix transcriptional regulator [Flammeovirga kamogawensis]|uniref:MarR family transcriptional regulator n=1 Tax=Flammeovirga kamogawensis TaxID=373891 RepID=A0ABX8GSI1_9BACT|nr:MarR family transcriptional regulator [Flammeovirga kamogawensis]MBB6461487.1 DNA-binding MarR family transcriptional regulator [Flammeovirga kamogawensis]QWG06379.1 MarR family transcriptional regulator [Flammeovirga kamogawensis]TRX68208.1 MarR family transcriptional regulator [Flammeovirga kamogawensis]